MSADEKVLGEDRATTAVGSALLSGIHDCAKADRQRVVLPEPEDDRILKAADWLLRDGVVDITFVGNEDRVRKRAGQLDLMLDEAEVIDPETDRRCEEFAQFYYQSRKDKGVTHQEAHKVIVNPLYFGASLVRAGVCDGMVAGAASSTAKVIRSALHCVGLMDGMRTVSSFVLMVTEQTDLGSNGTFIFADCGCVPDPTASQLVDIAVASAQHCQMLLGSEPLIAFLSFSTRGSARHRLVDKPVEAMKLYRQGGFPYKADGELQLDAAIIPSIGRQKAEDSDVAGKANVLIFPDLNAGNIGYKLVERFARARAVGPILQGLAMPVNDLSRGCRWQDITCVAAITAIQAQTRKAQI